MGGQRGDRRCRRRRTTSTAWVARDASSGTAIHCTPAHGSSSSSGKIQRLAASATASIVARPTARWSALFHAGARLAAPALAVVLGDDDVGPVAADRGGDVAAQVEALDDAPVGMAEELDLRDADDRPAGPLLGLAGGARPSSGASESMPASPDVTST